MVLVSLAGCYLPGRFMRGYAEAEPEGMKLLSADRAYANAPPSVRGQVRFLFDDFGSLNTDNLDRYGQPWKMVGAAIVRDRHRTEGAPLTRGTLERALKEYGFIRPTAVANWAGPQPRFERPMGMIAGMARRGFPGVEIEVSNLGCATCHAGPLYGADGRTTGEVWLGLPNSSIDLDAYSEDAFVALRSELEEPDSLLATLALVFPEVSERELSNLREHVMPAARKELAVRLAEHGGLVPFGNGGPGLMNGIGSLSFLREGLHGDVRSDEVAWAAPPDLAATTMRRSLLVDGVYAAPGRARHGPMTHDEVDGAHLDGLAGVASFFIVTTQGVLPREAQRAIPAVREVFDFLHAVMSPPFPGQIDHALALEGAAVYANACAACHGEYSSGLEDVRLLAHPNRLTPQDRMLTDSIRWAAADLDEATRHLGSMGYLKHLEIENGGGYVAPDLGGVWATAPYLHNGSVPTLWHLLHAEHRPERFYVGGHALDYDLMGIAGEVDADGVYRYLDGYQPWSRPALYDTREPGRSNAGHEFRLLKEAEKAALLEYLKLL